MANMIQESLTLPYVVHSTTSRDAAEQARPHAGTQRRLVLDALLAAPDSLTDEELQLRLHLNPSAQRPRRIELVNAGFAADSGRVRATRSGRSAVVWVAVRGEGER